MSNYETLQSYQEEFYQGFLEMQKILFAQGKQFDEIDSSVEDILANQYVQSLTEWGVAIWSSFLRIKLSDFQTLEEKRAIIGSVLSGHNIKFNTFAIKSIGFPYNSLGEMDVFFENSRIVINFIRGKSANPPLLLPTFQTVIENLKPAHLGYDVEVTNKVDLALKCTYQKVENLYEVCSTDTFCGEGVFT